MISINLSRRTFATATVCSIVTAVAPSLWAQSHLEKPKITIAVGGKSSLYYLPLTIAEQLGFFKSAGLEVEIIDFAGGSRAMQAVTEGAADVVSGAFEHTINLQSRGKKYQSFVLQGRAPAISLGISSKTMPEYKSVADLKGKRIGISAPGSSTNMVANLILARAGLKPGDVGFVGVGTASSALMAWRNGQIDAMSNADPVMSILEQKGELRIVADTRTLKGSVDIFGGAMPAGCLFAAAEFIQKNPNTVQALTTAMVRSLKWLQTAGPSDLIKTVPESYLLGDRASYLAAFNKVHEVISPSGLMFDEGPRTALKVLSRLDSTFRADKIDINAAYTNAFAKKAQLQLTAYT